MPSCLISPSISGIRGACKINSVPLSPGVNQQSSTGSTRAIEICGLGVKVQLPNPINLLDPVLEALLWCRRPWKALNTKQPCCSSSLWGEIPDSLQKALIIPVFLGNMVQWGLSLISTLKKGAEIMGHQRGNSVAGKLFQISTGISGKCLFMQKSLLGKVRKD